MTQAQRVLRGEEVISQSDLNAWAQCCQMLLDVPLDHEPHAPNGAIFGPQDALLVWGQCPAMELVKVAVEELLVPT